MSKPRTTKPRSKALTAAERNAAYRARMRALGLRQVQIWVPDVKTKKFQKQIQAAVEAINLAQHHEEEKEVMRFIEAAVDWSDIG